MATAIQEDAPGDANIDDALFADLRVRNTTVVEIPARSLEGLFDLARQPIVVDIVVVAETFERPQNSRVV